MPASRSLPLMLAGVGLISGAFGALFGVGGGLVIVPLLMLVLKFGPHKATGTSLAVIGFTALFATLAYGALGDIDWVAAAEVGTPATAGVLAGTSIQKRLSSRTLVRAFAGFLVLIAIRLLTE